MYQINVNSSFWYQLGAMKSFLFYQVNAILTTLYQLDRLFRTKYYYMLVYKIPKWSIKKNSLITMYQLHTNGHFL